jgi:hypothetical protein
MPNEGNRELALPWHEPLPLSKPVYAQGWRFMGKLFSGLGFAATPIAGRCSGFAPAAIAASVIAARRGAVMRGAGDIAPPIGVISRAPRGGWIIATGSVRIVAAAPRRRVTDQGSQAEISPPPSESGKAVTMPVLAPLRVRPRERRGNGLRCMVCGRAGRFVDPFPRTSFRR